MVLEWTQYGKPKMRYRQLLLFRSLLSRPISFMGVFPVSHHIFEISVDFRAPCRQIPRKNPNQIIEIRNLIPFLGEISEIRMHQIPHKIEPENVHKMIGSHSDIRGHLMRDSFLFLCFKECRRRVRIRPLLRPRSSSSPGLRKTRQ